MTARLVLFALLALGACTVSPHHPERAVAAPSFDVERFFAGSSHGEGVLKVVFRAPVAVHVASEGRIEGDTLVLDQRIAQGGALAPDPATPIKPAKRREWRIREVSPGRYAGTLSDAAGPVSGTTTGDRLVLRFRMKGGLDATQWLTLQPGGRVALNRMVVAKWGIRVATLDERITKG